MDGAEWAVCIADAAFEVIPGAGCGSARGWLISETPGMRVFMDMQAEEREVSPDVAHTETATASSALDSGPLVENVIRWHMEERTASGAVDVGVPYECKVDYKLRDLAVLGTGEVLVLGESVTGECWLESWVLSKPVGPGPEGALRIPVESFERAHMLKDFDVETGSAIIADFGPMAYSKVVWRQRLGGLPVALDADVSSGLVFLLSREPGTKATTLWMLDPEKAWARTRLQTSETLPTLSASVELEVFPLGGGQGFLLAASGVGFCKETMEGVETHFVHEILCWVDRDGDGSFEVEQVFADRAAFLAYERNLAGVEAGQSTGSQ